MSRSTGVAIGITIVIGVIQFTGAIAITGVTRFTGAIATGVTIGIGDRLVDAGGGNPLSAEEKQKPAAMTGQFGLAKS